MRIARTESRADSTVVVNNCKPSQENSVHSLLKFPGVWKLPLKVTKSPASGHYGPLPTPFQLHPTELPPRSVGCSPGVGVSRMT